MNPFESRRLCVAVLDMLVALILYFVGKYGPPGAVDDAKFFILTIQPVVGILIVMYTADDIHQARMNVAMARLEATTFTAGPESMKQTHA